ncbi:MAG: TerB family tellurite resistance protein [Gammaproteobacteria bacterium]|nr:TerB family tellurite resistance protein [Gammaproteobacteria bacterium]
MFKSLQHWFEALAERGKLFADEDEAIRTALASVLFHVIKADALESAKEKAKFEQIMTSEFGIDHAAVAHLYHSAHALESDLQTDLLTLKDHLKNNPNVRMSLMQKLNHVVSLDGVDAREIAVFNEAVAVMFPELSRDDTDI